MGHHSKVAFYVTYPKSDVGALRLGACRSVGP